MDNRDSSATLTSPFSKEHVKRTSLPTYEPVSRSDYDPYEDQEPEYQGHDYHPDDYQLQVKPWTRRKAFWITIIAAAAAIVLAVVLPVVLIIDKRHGETSTSAAQPTTTTNGSKPVILTTGGDGSTVTLANGSTFTYSNKFGGFWVDDPTDPFSSNAQPNSWTSPLNQSWKWGSDRIRGVNLGGWLVLEPFISPRLFQKYPQAVDEYSLSVAMAADAASGGLNQLEQHYATFITEQDFALIAGAGLNFVRIPIGFWSLKTMPGEPYLGGKGWEYALKAMNWCRKYGLRMVLDLHAVPGSQNGFNHGGRLTAVGFLHENMGYANAQRTLDYLRAITEFISQKEYQSVVVALGILNEPDLGALGMNNLLSFYLESHDMIRNITGFGEGNGPYIFIHDAFQTKLWNGALAGSDRMGLELHEYFSFGGVDTAPLDVPAPDGQPGGKWPLQACQAWGPLVNTGRQNFGFTSVGEYTASPTDCGLFVIGVGTSSQNPDCATNVDWQNFNDTMKAGIQNFVKASMDILGDSFFWTWKIGPSQSGNIEAPMWSYQLGLENGWIPTDPRTSDGKCAAVGSNQTLFTGPYQPWQTGASTSTIALSSRTQFPWPPPTISGAQVPFPLLPSYTNTGSIFTLPTATFTSAPSSATASVDGWFDDNDKAPGITPVAGCTYPDEYFATFTVTPTAPCTGTGAAAPPPPTVGPAVPTSVVVI